MRRSAILLILIVIFPWRLFSQQPIINSYSLQDGMVSNNVRRIFQDSKGFIWIGTWEGISQYNGHKFTNYTTLNGLSHSLVNDFFEVDGKVFVTLNDGSIDCIANGRITKFSKNLDEPTDLIKLSANNYIIPTVKGIFKYVDGKIVKPKQEKPDLRIEYMLQVNDTLFLGAIPGKAHQLVALGKDYKIVATFPIANEVIRSLYKDSKNRIWFCTENGLRLINFDPEKLSCEIVLPPVSLVPAWSGNTGIYFIKEDDRGGLWMGTVKGLAHIDPNGNYYLYTETDGLPSSLVYSIFIDKEKNIWLGTTNGLAKIVSKTGITTITPDNGGVMNEAKMILPVGKDRVLITSLSGPKLYQPGIKEMDKISFQGEQPTFLIPGSNPVIFGSPKSIGYYDSINKKIIPLSTAPFYLTDQGFCVDRKGNVFFGIQGGVGVVSEKRVMINTSLPLRVTSLTVDKKGALWAGTWFDGLYRINYSFVGDSLHFETKDLSHLVPDKYIRSLYTDKEGNVWVGTRYRGAFRLTPGLTSDYTVISFDQQHGLSSNFIKSFAETPTGDIWVGTFYGLNKLVKEKNQFKVFNFSKVANFFYELFQIVNAGDNEWWCVTRNKIVKFRDENLEKVPLSKAEITLISLGNQQDRINIYNTDTVITLKYFQNYASFEFSSPGFINEKQNQYSYRLLGTIDTMWSIPGNGHDVSYASLQPGKYTFEVRTIGWNGEAGESASFNFRIQPPFWKMGWFISFVIAVIGLLLYVIYRYRIRQLQRIQQVRNRIATDLHDDIGSTLTNISILTELSKRNRNDPEKSEAYLDRIREEIDASGQALDDIIWSVNTKNDTLQETAARMRRYAAELFDAANIRYELKMDPLIAEKKIMMEQRRDLFLIFKELLNNIQKHAAASVVSISLFIENNNLKLLIIDDGKGFDTTKLTHRNGISNIRNRVNRWKGAITIHSGNGNGTTVDVRLPFYVVTQKGD
jgi:ligand-binding sensor domain-containing protein/two-component sensor histidine kinase